MDINDSNQFPVSSEKKRDSDQVVTGGVSESNKQDRSSKKSRKTTAAAAAVAARRRISSNSKEVPSGGGTAIVNDDDPRPEDEVWDLESALHRIVRLGGDDTTCKEYLTKSCWVTFRVGHAGDASVLASCYHSSGGTAARDQSEEEERNLSRGESDDKRVSSSRTNDRNDDSSLEVWLADGLGDEDMPPSVYALLVDVHNDDEPSSPPRLGAAALLTTLFESSARVLRVEWLYIHQHLHKYRLTGDHEVEQVLLEDRLERRLWLRLSTLALMTSCDRLSVADLANQRPTRKIRRGIVGLT